MKKGVWLSILAVLLSGVIYLYNQINQYYQQ